MEGFENAEIGHVFACRQRIISPMIEWPLNIDSERQLGLNTLLKEKLMVVEIYRSREFKIGKSGKSEMLLVVDGEPMELWLNLLRCWINRVK